MAAYSSRMRWTKSLLKSSECTYLTLTCGKMLRAYCPIRWSRWFWPRPQSPVMTAFLAAVAGQFVFVLMLELPVSIAVMAGRDPLQALQQHFGQGGPLFLRAGSGGLATAALVFLLQ